MHTNPKDALEAISKPLMQDFQLRIISVSRGLKLRLFSFEIVSTAIDPRDVPVSDVVPDSLDLILTRDAHDASGFLPFSGRNHLAFACSSRLNSSDPAVASNFDENFEKRDRSEVK